MKSNLKIALTGVDGQLGWELQRTLSPLGQVCVSNHLQVDLSKPKNIRDWINELSPDIFINPAAYTAVDQAEGDKKNCFAVNSEAPIVIAEEMEKRKGVFIHYSTDYVFSGTQNSPYKEDDSKDPLSIYGDSKLKGEIGALSNSKACFIFRTSWVYSTRGKNFLLTLCRLLNSKKEINIVEDQIGSPTWARLIAEATSLIVAQGVCQGSIRDFAQSRTGVYHMTTRTQTSWYGFSMAIKKYLESTHESQLANIIPIKTSQYPTIAKRPLNSTLDNMKLKETFGLSLPTWETGLMLCLGS